MNNDITYKIRPSGRHIFTIGRDLIQDNFASVIELVKNAYDADSPDVNIVFRAKPDLSGYTISISDHGHGMSKDDVVNNWLVPSTQDKQIKKRSPSGRIMQGSKGVGRYAAAVLGENLTLVTVTIQNEKTTVCLEWTDFEEAEYLNDVDILVETVETSEPSGTALIINGDVEFLSEWNKDRFEKLRFELKKLTSPMSNILYNQDSGDKFDISLTIKGFPDMDDVKEIIEPYPLFELFDYKISGIIDVKGKGMLTYSSQKVRNTVEEKIPFDLGKDTGCGELEIDIRVFDREKEAIAALTKRGLKEESESPFGRLTARQLLNYYNGIGVYRNGFRIRPLGDVGYDWLKLNARRVNNPTLRIGSNQAIGYVQIQSADVSRLIEKSARDGLKENEAFNRLQEVTMKVISELEMRRYRYRKDAGLSRPTIKLEKNIQGLFSSDELIETVQSRLIKDGVDKTTIGKTLELINQDAQEKNKFADEIQNIVAIYQVEATLGKIVNVILHEGSKPLSYFNNQIPNLKYWFESFQKTSNQEEYEKIIRIVNGMVQNAEIFVHLFRRLDPLAARKYTIRKPLKLKKTIQDIFTLFEKEIKSDNISVEIKGPDDFKYSARIQDIYSIFVNLIDNSLFWIREKETDNRKIIIELKMDGNSLRYIDYHDTGPGIEPPLIESEVIFEPGFTTKPHGTGLGLAIAGEAAARNSLELEVRIFDAGAHFRLQPIMENE